VKDKGGSAAQEAKRSGERIPKNTGIDERYDIVVASEPSRRPRIKTKAERAAGDVTLTGK